MKKSKLSTLKAWAPLLTLTVAPTAQALGGLGIVDCGNSLAGAELSFWQPKDNNATFIDIRQYEVGVTKLFGGSGFLRGKGKFDQNNFNVEVLYTATGSKDTYIFGRLEGKKVSGQWSVFLTPEGSKQKIQLSCSEGNL